MKKHVKTTKDPLKEKNMSKRTPSPKPWVLEHMITESADMTRWGFKGKEKGVWYPENYSKYMSLEHALQQINKDSRNFPDTPDWRWRDREFRLVNKDTDEIVYLQFNGKEQEIKK